VKTLKRPDDEIQPELLRDVDYGWWASHLSPNALRALENGWQGIFRRSLLKLMPAEQLGEHFHDDFGRPSKELYAMAGILLIAEFKNLTVDQTAEAFTFDASIQYALNLSRDDQYLSPRTVDNYRRRFREDDLAREVFLQVTTVLVKELDLKTNVQRLDSTHVLSDMAHLKRGELVAVGVKRFLKQLLKNHPDAYARIVDADFEKRYEPEPSRLFGGSVSRQAKVAGTAGADVGGGKKLNPAERKAGKKAEKKRHLKAWMEEAGRDMAELIAAFTGDEAVEAMESFKLLKRIFVEQFEWIKAEDIIKKTLIKKPQGEDDEDPPGNEGAGKSCVYVRGDDDGDCDGENEEEKPILKARALGRDAQGKSSNVLQNPSDPEAGYSGHKGAGYQAQIAQAQPHEGADGKREGPGLITAVVAESAGAFDGHAIPAVFDELMAADLLPEKMTVDTSYGSDENVQHCAGLGIELISPVGGKAPVKANPKHKGCAKERQLKKRLAARREREKTEEWKTDYSKRNGIEGLNHALDVVTGFKRLRVRGLARVSMSLLLKAAGWNILAASQIRKHRQKMAKKVVWARNWHCNWRQVIRA
jgi:hypothetical protein